MAEILADNELLSGAAVYFAGSGEWVENLQLARVFGKDDVTARDEAIAASKKTMRINGIEIETVKVVDGQIVPDRLREVIRANGPTAPVFERQHLDEDSHVSI